ncbi:MAG: polysaccharide biosynthesis tyrosine autokinase [Clostridia bacterium]|nr:polysaccharide biosynthesis tyrosine autokinase [Clostridia bacterium]
MKNYESINLKRILEIAFSKKILIIFILAISITLGYGYSYYYEKPLYNSSAKILLVADESKKEKELTQNDLTINSSLISTYSSIAKSTSVIEKIISNLGLDITVKELQKNIEVSQINKTQFLSVSVKNEEAKKAKDIANELAKVFTEQINDIYKIENIKIVDEAEQEMKPCNVNHTIDMILSIALGIFLSGLLVMMTYFFDNTIKDIKDIEEKAKLICIGTLPISREKKNDLVIQKNPKSHLVECIKTIRTNVLYATNKKAILVTSPKKKEGKSWLVRNMAVAFAQANKKVILVDANLRKKSNVNKIFKIEEKEGLSNFIKEITENQLDNLEASRKYIQETQIPNLHILQNGTIPPNPAELLSSNNMRRLINLLKDMYDIILIDGESCNVVSDSIALSNMVDGTILIVENKKTKINDIIKTKRKIEDVNGKILGVVSNRFEQQTSKYYGKGYKYYYGEETNLVTVEKQKIISLEEIIEVAKTQVKEKEIKKNNEEEKKELEEKNTPKYKIKKVINGNHQTILNKILQDLEMVKFEAKETRINQVKNNEKFKIKIEEMQNNEQMRKENEQLRLVIEKMQEEVNKANESMKELKVNQLQIQQANELIEKTIIEEIQNKKKIKRQENKQLQIMLEKMSETINKVNEGIKDLNESKVQIQQNSEAETKTEKLNVVEECDNKIISFETLKRKKRTNNKKIFNIEETINYEDLEKTSDCIIINIKSDKQSNVV